MNIDSLKIWSTFKSCFENRVKGLSESELKRFKTTGDRKYLFNESVLPKVAEDMGYKMRPEFLRVDYTFMAVGKNGFQVPVVCIESENNFDSCYEETLKLCALNVPLKILITYGMPAERAKDFGDNDIVDAYIFADFLEKTNLIGCYGILIYDDTDEEIKFHVFLYNEKGERVLDECGQMVINSLKLTKVI